LIEATGETFDALLAQDEQLVVAYFWGTDCVNCEVFARDLPALMPQVPATVRFLKVNAYEDMDLARRYGLFGVPAFLFFRSGKLIGKMSEYYGREYWLTVLKEQAARVTG
jgi:thiol-disulfide isomerase/thioredoxin